MTHQRYYIESYITESLLVRPCENAPDNLINIGFLLEQTLAVRSEINFLSLYRFDVTCAGNNLNLVLANIPYMEEGIFGLYGSQQTFNNIYIICVK